MVRLRASFVPMRSRHPEEARRRDLRQSAVYLVREDEAMIWT
jgi:hypothetical protein